MIVDVLQIENNIKYSNYKYIGQGSSRKVYDMKNGYVVKVAKNRAGKAQNKVEYRISRMDDTGIFAEVKGISDDYKYLIMEKAKAIKEYKVVLNYFNVISKEELKRIDIISEIMNNYALLWGDIKKKTSWGIINNKLVIIDYGFTQNIRKKYY